MEELFSGEPLPLPVGHRGRWAIRVGEARPAPVRHAAGYAELLGFVARIGDDPRRLADDPVAVVRFVADHAQAMRDAALAAATAVFLGNAIAARHPRAAWQATESPRIGTDAWGLDPARMVEVMSTEPERLDDLVPRLDAALLDDLDRVHDVADTAMEQVRAIAEAAALEDAPRFAPAEADRPAESVAAIAQHLRGEYDCEVHDGPDGRIDVRPARGAPIRLTALDDGGVRLHAGLLLDEYVLALDTFTGHFDGEAFEYDPVPRLLTTIAGIVRGGFAEVAPVEPRTGAYHLRTSEDEWSSGGLLDLDPDEPASPDDLAALGGGAWPAWPRR